MFAASGTDKQGRPFEMIWDRGRINGSGNALLALGALKGQTVKETPTGPSLAYDVTDPAAVAAGVRAFASAEVEWFGEVPRVAGLPPDSEG